MRKARFLAPGAQEGRRAGIYHCISRVVDRRLVLKRTEKEHFVRLLRLYEHFCGVRVLAFCVMSNHFHLLLEVPPRPVEGLSDQAFFARLRLLVSEGEIEQLRRLIRAHREAGSEAGAEALKEKYLYRMWDLSQFMKTLKQRFTQWFNKRHGRRGTLWEDRFKSVIVEDGYAARVVAAYIDLNPVRAGLVKDPKDYRWCSYGEVVGGVAAARAGIERVMGVFEEWVGHRRKGKDRSWRRIIADYRVILFTDGEERLQEGKQGQIEAARRGVSREAGQRERAREGQLSRSELLQQRVRHFADGAVIGSAEFVESIFQEARERFGPRRRSGARRIRESCEPLCALRDLRGGLG